MAKNLIEKYVWLVETIYQAEEITFEEINERWLDKMEAEGEKKDDLPLRTFHTWCNAIEEIFDINIECKRKGGYHYYIEDSQEIKQGSLRGWLLDTISVSNMLMNSKQIKDRILLEDIPSGQDDLPIILDAMKTNRVLTITYQSYWSEESNTFEVEPYCVKLFKQRWYMVARSPYYDRVLIYALDRITDISDKGNKKFKMPKDFNPELFFKDYYGIIAGTNRRIETVKLKVSAGQANYLESLKLHESQRPIESKGEYSIFRLRLRPEFDFQQMLLSMGEDVEVIEPLWLRQEIAEKTERMWNLYKNDNK